MSIDAGGPVLACRCLNIRFFKGNESSQRQRPQVDASAEYQPFYVGDEGIKISHVELTLRTRSPVVNDSASPTGRTQQTLVTCFVCDTAAYRITTDIPLDEDAKEGPVLPTEDWAERDTLRSRSGYVDVHVGKGGCITEDEIKRIMSSSSYSQYFSLNVSPEYHVHLTTAKPVLPQARLTIPAEHSFLPTLPPFLQPPPFTPSHPIFLHLSSVVAACSNDARRDAEKRIEDFARQELIRLEEHETALRSQLEHLWWIVKEGLKKAEEERDAKLLYALQSRRRGLSPLRAVHSVSGGVDSAVRNFAPATFHAPRTVHVPTPGPSALSASLATSSFHHPRARQESNAAHSVASAVAAGDSQLLPSPPPSYPASSKSSTRSDSGSIASPSRSFKRNMNASNDVAVTYRYYVIEEQEAERRKAREAAKKDKDAKETKQNGREPNKTDKRAETSDKGQNESTTTVKAEKEKESSNEPTSPKKKDGRRKVTFSVEPNVVTIKRDITSEAKEERIPEKGEDLLFDMDGVDSATVTGTERKDEAPSENIPSEAETEIPFREAAERPTRTSKRSNDLKNAGLPQSFASLRPSSLPAPSHIRPPMRGRSRESVSKPRLNSSSPSRNSSSAKGKEIDDTPSDTRLSDRALSPEQKNFLKLVGADMPSHRGLWKPGTDAWKIFDRNARGNGAILEEDEEEDESETSGTNSRNEEELEWRHYRRTDIIGSLPIPMAPISQQRSSGSASLLPKTPMANGPGTLVPSLPAVAEEDDVATKGKSPAAIRREVYAERNKVRGLDPGVLDFVDDDDGDVGDTEIPDQDTDVNQVATSRSRQHALNIIRARDSIPPEGLWRSLAD